MIDVCRRLDAKIAVIMLMACWPAGRCAVRHSVTDDLSVELNERLCVRVSLHHAALLMFSKERIKRMVDDEDDDEVGG